MPASYTCATLSWATTASCTWRLVRACLYAHPSFHGPTAEMVQIYRDEVLPLASVITPNGFEAEQLTGPF